MAKLKSTKFTVETFSSQKEWIGMLLSPLNSLMNDLQFAFQGNITMENLSQEIKSLSFTNNSVSMPLVFQQRFNRRIAGITIISCMNRTTGLNVSIGSLPVWTSSKGQITISSIDGLIDGAEYTIKFHIIYEDK